MHFVGPLDIVVFLVFVGSVIAIGLWKSRGEETHGEKGAQNYFLAGRGLTWWLVGFSLIAANISTEQFVGMSGKAADWLGMAIASYEWMAAITLVVVAFVFLPTFLRSGIYTIPEFLEYRYNTFARSVMAVFTLVIVVLVPTASVIFSGAKVITGNFQGLTVFGFDLGSITVGCWIIGTLAAVYVFAGGLKACAWADLLQGSALIVGGVIIALFAMRFISDAKPEDLIKSARNDQVTTASLKDAGAIDRFWQLNKGPLPDGKVHMVRGATDPEIPWTALIVGLWIPNFFYWGLNQYITQRTLGAKSLAEGQKGVVFAAFLKLIVPFVVVVPGMMAFNLFDQSLKDDAITTNAKLIASQNPTLYKQLSQSMLPDENNPRNKQVIENINKDLAKKPAPDVLHLYKFDALFAELHPDDALTIAQFDFDHLQKMDSQAAPPSAGNTAKQLSDYVGSASAALVKVDDTAKVDTLLARDYDSAFPTLIRKLMPVNLGIKGFVLAAIFGAVVSSLASMLNSASTIATMDIYRKFRKEASQYELVSVGRVWVVVFVVIAMFIAPFLGRPQFHGIFTYIQEFQGFISPGILAIFLFGLLVHRAPRMVGTVGLVLNPILYGALKWGWPSAWHPISFLDRMAICFFVIVGVLTVMTLVRPLAKPVELPVNKEMRMETSKSALAFGILVVVLTVALYIVFW